MSNKIAKRAGTFENASPSCAAIEKISIEDIPHQIWYLISPREYGQANKAHADFLAWDLAKVCNCDIYDILPKNEADEYFKANVNVFESKKPTQTYGWITGKNAGRKYLSITKVPKLNSKGEVAYVVCSATDITEQKEIEENLKNTEQKYKIIVDNTTDIIVVLNNNGKLIFINDRQNELLGYDNNEILGSSFMRFVPSHLLPSMRNKLQLVLKSKHIEKFQSKLRHKDGGEIDVEIVGRAISYEGKTTIHCTISDISKRKQAEKELQYQLELRKTIMELSSDFINIPIHKTTEAINYSLKRLANFVGADRSYIFDYDHKKQIAINTNEYCQENIEPQIQYLQAVPFSEFAEWLQKHNQGEDIEILNVSTYPHKSIRNILEQQRIKSVLTVPLMHGNRCMGFIGFDFVDHYHAFTDDEKQMIKVFAQLLVNVQLRSKAEGNNAKLLMAIEQNPTSIVITNKEGIIEYANPITTISTGYNNQELVGKKCSIFKSGFHDNHFYKTLWETILHHKIWRGELLNKKKNGELIWERTVISPIFTEKGGISHFVSVKLDISERKAMIRELQQAKEKAEESDRLKSAFLANMSHEIRSPLNGIIGFATILTEELYENPEDIQHYATIISNSGNHLLSIINDLIHISKLDSGFIKPNPEPTLVNDLLNELIQIYTELIHDRQRPIKITLQVPDAPLCTNTDPTRLRQILENLLSNALKFTMEGSISMSCSIKKDMLYFVVSDTGIGIETDKQERVFDRFIQASSNTERKYGGTGLGLSISKACVEMLGGHIWLESQPNQGTTFYFTIKHNMCERVDSGND